MIVVIAWVFVVMVAVMALGCVGLAVMYFSDGIPALGFLYLALASLCACVGIWIGDSAVNGPLYECDYVESSPGVYVEQCERVR